MSSKKAAPARRPSVKKTKGTKRKAEVPVHEIDDDGSDVDLSEDDAPVQEQKRAPGKVDWNAAEKKHQALIAKNAAERNARLQQIVSGAADGADEDEEGDEDYEEGDFEEDDGEEEGDD